MRKSILLASALMLLIACGGKKTSSDDAAVADSANVQATAVADSVATVADEATDDEDTIDELVFAPDLKSDKPLDLSDGKDKAAKYFPVWDEDIVYEEDEEEGVVRYQLSLGYDRPLQQFMLGPKYLVAPVVSADGSVTAEIPSGAWKDPRGMIVEGPKSLRLEKVPLSFLPYFERQ